MWKDLKDYTDSDLILAFQDVGNTPRKMRDAIIDELARRRELGVRYAVKQPVSQTEIEMNKEFVPPSPELLKIWNKGDALTDDQLNELENFFSVMLKGLDALGERYSLATMALRREWHRADEIKRYRKRH